MKMSVSIVRELETCYQNAQADPEGVDRERGRIWRVVYTGKNSGKKTGSRPDAKMDVNKLKWEELLKLLEHPNVWQKPSGTTTCFCDSADESASELAGACWPVSCLPAPKSCGIATKAKKRLKKCVSFWKGQPDFVSSHSLRRGKFSFSSVFARVSSVAKMKAVILAAGKGTRMRELTNEVPKPMLKVHGKPILEHIMEGLMTAGIREFFIVTGFKAETIENYFGDGKKLGVKICYGRQIVQDGTGKAPELAKDFVGSNDFVLTYGDILVKPETYQQMLRRFREGKFSGLVTAIGSQDITKGGLYFFDKDFFLVKLVEKATAAQLEELRREGRLKPGDVAWYNAGIYIFKPTLFHFTAQLEKSPRGEYELTDAIIAMLGAELKIAGLEIQGRWVDVRDPEVLTNLENEL